jgi:thiamine-monophosphate kinase
MGGRVPLGIGDDAALVRVAKGHELILTADLSIEGVHFLQGLHPARSVGHRALARALSDVAAMGGKARFALISLALSRTAPRRWVEGFYEGVRMLARQTGVAIIGGDTARLRGKMMVDVVVAGEVPNGAAVLRSGALPGDHVFVSGRLGLSAWGLRLLKKSSGATGTAASPAIHAHLFPQPRLELGQFLGAKRLATSLIDLSDGLSTDLARLCTSSGVGVRLLAANIPGPEITVRGVSRARQLDLSLNGGEDYELLFTVRPAKAHQIPGRFKGIPLRHIGEIRGSKRLELILPDGKTRPLTVGGYDHFRK